MKDDEKSKNDAVQPVSSIVDSQVCLFAETPKGVTIGVVSTSEPSSLTLLATGVAGMAARRARLERAKKTP
jgi:PEP-CTERM motif